jgi:hypothetical protein
MCGLRGTGMQSPVARLANIDRGRKQKSLGFWRELKRWMTGRFGVAPGKSGVGCFNAATLLHKPFGAVRHPGAVCVIGEQVDRHVHIVRFGWGGGSLESLNPGLPAGAGAPNQSQLPFLLPIAPAGRPGFEPGVLAIGRSSDILRASEGYLLHGTQWI